MRTCNKHRVNFLTRRDTISFAREATLPGVCYVVNSGILFDSGGAKIFHLK